jgi:hypothetical protein
MPRQQSSNQNQKPFYTRQSPLAPPVPYTPHLPQQPGFLSSMWQGFGLGTGSSIAHNMFDRTDKSVRSVETMSPPDKTDKSVETKSPPDNDKTIIHKQETPKSKYCAKEKEVFDKCIEHRQTLEECERTLKDLHACYDEHSFEMK